MIYDRMSIAKYEKEPLQSNQQNFHLLISATKQDDNVTVIDETGKILNPKEVLRDRFKNLEYMSYDDFPNYDVLNCNPCTEN
jgi:hypothetical protein